MTSIPKKENYSSSSYVREASDDSSVLIYCFEAPLIFTNVEFFKKSVEKVFKKWAAIDVKKVNFRY